MMVVKHWNRLTMEIMGGLSLDSFMVRVDEILSNWPSERCPHPWQWGWTRSVFEGLFQPKLSYHSNCNNNLFSIFFFFPFVFFPQRLQCERHACASEWNNLDEMFKLELFWIWELSRSVELLLHFFQAHKMSSPKSKSSSHIFLWTPIFLQFIELFCALLNSSIAITLLLTGKKKNQPNKCYTWYSHLQIWASFITVIYAYLKPTIYF